MTEKRNDLLTFVHKHPLLLMTGIYLLTQIMFHLMVRIDYGDDIAFFATSWTDHTLPAYWKYSWYEWGARLLVNTLTSLFCYLPHFIWGITDIAFLMLLHVFLTRILKWQKNLWGQSLLFMGVLAIPFWQWKSAGWIATTTNYFWTTALAVYVCWMLVAELRKEKVAWFHYVFFLPAFLVATDAELICAMMLAAVAAVMILSLIKEKKVTIFQVIFLVVTILKLIMIFACPGTGFREYTGEVEFFPGFEALGLFSKVYIGFTNSWDSLMVPHLVWIPLMYSVMMVIAVFRSQKDPVVRVVSLLPGAFFLAAILMDLLANLHLMSSFIPHTAYIVPANLYEPVAYRRFFLFMFLSGCLFAGTFYSTTDAKEGLKRVLILFFACTTGVATGLSSSVYISYYRPIIYLMFVLLLLFAVMAEEHKGKWRLPVLLFLYGGALLHNLYCYFFAYYT